MDTGTAAAINATFPPALQPLQAPPPTERAASQPAKDPTTPAAPPLTRWTVDALSRIPLHLAWPSPAMHDDSASDDDRKAHDREPAATSAAEPSKHENGTPKDADKEATSNGDTPNAAASAAATPGSQQTTPKEEPASSASAAAVGEGTSAVQATSNQTLPPTFSDRQLVAQGQPPQLRHACSVRAP